MAAARHNPATLRKRRTASKVQHHNIVNYSIKGTLTNNTDEVDPTQATWAA
jgi:hypothetical protein